MIFRRHFIELFRLEYLEDINVEGVGGSEEDARWKYF